MEETNLAGEKQDHKRSKFHLCVPEKAKKKRQTVHSGLGDEKNDITSSPPKKKGKWKKRATDNKFKSQAILINTNLITVIPIFLEQVLLCTSILFSSL